MAMLGKELLKYPDILKFTSIYEDYLTKPDGSQIWLVNTNRLVRFYEGVDGLKTGFTTDAGYCLTATAKRNDLRLISVVMGAETTDKRSTDTLAMLDYGFNRYSIDKVVSSDKALGKIKINLGDNEEADIISVKDINILNDSQKGKRNITYKIDTKSINAPIKKGDVIGKITVYENGKYLSYEDITVVNDVKKANIFKILARNLKDIMGVNL